MSFKVAYKPLAQLEIAEAYAWYAQSEIAMGAPFMTELERVDGFLSRNPHLYPCLEAEVRRAILSRFPYSLYFVINGDTVNVLSCFHQHRKPLTRDELQARGA